MTKKKDRLPLSPEWTVISNYAKESDFIKTESQNEKPNFDIYLDKRIRWYLKYGAVTTLYIIKESCSDKDMNLFIDFVKDYLKEPDDLGGFHESTRLHSQLAFYHNSAQLFDFESYLKDLRKEFFEEDGTNEETE